MARADGIHTIPLGLSTAYLLEGHAGMILVDAGAPRQERHVLDRMAALGRDDLRLIFITHAHFDHYGSAAQLRRLTGASIAIHHADAEALTHGETRLGSVRGRGVVIRLLMPLLERIFQPIPTPPDILLHDGDQLDSFGLDAQVRHSPGHTAGSSSLLLDRRIAFVGDLISSTGRPHAQRYYAEDWDQLAESLRLLQALGPDWVYAGHGQLPVAGDVFQQI